MLARAYFKVILHTVVNRPICIYCSYIASYVNAVLLCKCMYLLYIYPCTMYMMLIIQVHLKDTKSNDVAVCEFQADITHLHEATVMQATS